MVSDLVWPLPNYCKMGLSLAEQDALAGMADILYDFLPGSGSGQWSRHVTFATVAAKIGVGDNWTGGSKLPAITQLLSRTLEYDRSSFQALVIEIVRSAIRYRQSKGVPTTAKEIDLLNGHILELGFKFPELWDPDFKRSLDGNPEKRAQQRIDEVVQQERVKETARDKRQADLEALKESLIDMHAETDRVKAGFMLERLLNELFKLGDLNPRESFRVVGEQIDGSFELDHEVYLVEAKWEQEPISENPLLVFRDKIEGKSSITRGVFISMSNISHHAKAAITQGKQPTFFVIDGHDLMMVVSAAVELVDFLRQRRRLLGEEGIMCVPFGELWRAPGKGFKFCLVRDKLVPPRSGGSSRPRGLSPRPG